MSDVVKRTQEELYKELCSRFGKSPLDWAFVCPSCGDVATGRDFWEATGRGDDLGLDRLGQDCIGRKLGVLARDVGREKWKGRGCDWAAYGLFQGPEFVIMPDGREVPSFAIAEVSR